MGLCEITASVQAGVHWRASPEGMPVWGPNRFWPGSGLVLRCLGPSFTILALRHGIRTILFYSILIIIQIISFITIKHTNHVLQYSRTSTAEAKVDALCLSATGCSPWMTDVASTNDIPPRQNPQACMAGTHTSWRLRRRPVETHFLMNNLLAVSWSCQCHGR